MKRVIRVMFEGTGPRVTGYPYLWIKAVTGFDHRAHCARCLKGPFLKATGDWVPPPNHWHEYTVPASAKALYICGVSKKGYVFNLHAPCLPENDVPFAGRLRHHAGFAMPLMDEQRLVVEGAVLMEIPALPDGWHHLPKSFTRCRNFQFGVQYFGWPEPGRSLLEDCR